MTNPLTTPPGEDHATLVMPTADHPAPEEIRSWIGEALAELPDVDRLHATLVAGELVDNARRHGAAPYVLRLATVDGGRTLTVSVDDCTTPDGPAPSGSELVLVGGLSRRWGAEQRRRARTVWAELVPDGPGLRLVAPDQPVPLPRPGPGTAR